MADLFDAQTKDIIESRMAQVFHTLARSDRSAMEGTFARDMIDTNAVEFENSYAEMAMLKEAAFAETSWGEYLTLRASEFGIDRKKAVKAEGSVTVTGVSGAYIIRGSLFQTKEGLKFYTKESATIPDGETSVDIPVEASDAGSTGNAAAGSITEIPYSIPNVYSVNNKQKCTDGADEETDEALLERLLFRVRQPITSGNANHYRDWALSVDGVGSCKVIPLWNGNGTVKVIIVTAQNESASPELIQTIYDYIESQRPIGATVTVVSPAPLAVDVAATIYGSADAAKVKEALSAYFRQTGFSLSYVSIAQIGKLLLGIDGIKDYKDLTLNGEGKNIELTNEQLPGAGKVVLIVAEE